MQNLEISPHLSIDEQELHSQVSSARHKYIELVMAEIPFVGRLFDSNAPGELIEDLRTIRASNDPNYIQEKTNN